MRWAAAAAVAVVLGAAVAGRHFLLKGCHAWRLQWAGAEDAWELAERLERGDSTAREAAEEWYLEGLEAPAQRQAGTELIIESATVENGAQLTCFHKRGDEPRKRAATRLAQMASRRAIEPLSQQLEEADPDLPLLELETFGRGRPLKNRLICFHYTTLALYRIGAPAVPALSRALQSRKLNVRVQAAFALSCLGSEAAAAIPALLVAIEDADWNVRSQALDALVAQDPLRGEVIASLVEMARDKEQPRADVNALARLAARSAGALQALCEILLDEDADPVLRRKTAEVTGDYKLRGDCVIRTLVSALQDTDDSFRCAAVDSLRKLEARGETVVKALTRILREDPKITVRRKAAYTLGTIGPEAASAAPALREALRDADTDLRRTAEEALRRLEDGS